MTKSLTGRRTVLRTATPTKADTERTKLGAATRVGGLFLSISAGPSWDGKNETWRCGVLFSDMNAEQGPKIGEKKACANSFLTYRTDIRVQKGAKDGRGRALARPRYMRARPTCSCMGSLAEADIDEMKGKRTLETNVSKRKFLRQNRLFELARPRHWRGRGRYWWDEGEADPGN